MLRKNKGITLIALIITIIVMMILVAVSVTVALNGGLFDTAKKASSETQLKADEEILLSAVVGAIGTDAKVDFYKLDKNLPDGFIGENGTYTSSSGNIFIVDNNGNIYNSDIKIVGNTNPPNIDGFNKNSTFYVRWSKNAEDSSVYDINESVLISAEAPTDWYDYTAGENKWANIKTTGGGNDCYWVWIPRYAYKVPEKSDTAQTIEIKFLKGTTNIPIGETEIITNTIPTPGSWVVHPAFTNEGNNGFGELTGIWVAKFEASSSSNVVVENPTVEQLATDGGTQTDTELKIRVKPNVTSWRGITVNNAFIVCQNLVKDGNSLAGAKNIDPHLMKNTEWGACAYLSRSIYGKNDVIWNNPYYNNTTNYSPITGLAGTSKNSSQTVLNYEEGTNKLYKYNTTGGTNASTTGNVYGIYDMAGGAWEFVAGYEKYSIENSSTIKDNMLSLYNAAPKYKDIYEGGEETYQKNYEKNSSKYGDAIFETSLLGTGSTSWDNGLSEFKFDLTYGGLRRGGHANGYMNGIFGFAVGPTVVNSGGTFRPTLVCPGK